jgi:hypothetical protein
MLPLCIILPIKSLLSAMLTCYLAAFIFSKYNAALTHTSFSSARSPLRLVVERTAQGRPALGQGERSNGGEEPQPEVDNYYAVLTMMLHCMYVCVCVCVCVSVDKITFVQHLY